jgi:hypothetical protein
LGFQISFAGMAINVTARKGSVLKDYPGVASPACAKWIGACPISAKAVEKAVERGQLS